MALECLVQELFLTGVFASYRIPEHRHARLLRDHSALVPQIVKIIKTKRARDVSANFRVLHISGVSMLLVYGYGENLLPIYIPATAEFLTGVSMLAAKLYFDRRADKLTGGNDDPNAKIELDSTERPTSFVAAKTP